MDEPFRPRRESEYPYDRVKEVMSVNLIHPPNRAMYGGKKMNRKQTRKMNKN